MANNAVPGLVQQIRRFGNFDANACLSCGSCTVVCTLSDGTATFPRKPIRRALLGLKGSLLAGLEPWLCHDCGDCSIACPRQAEPRESMMTLRRYLIAQYDLTRLASVVLGSRVGEILALSVVGLIVFGLVLYYHFLYAGIPMTVAEFIETPMGLEHMFPLIWDFTIVVFLIPIALVLANIFRMHHFTMREAEGRRVPLRAYLAEAKTVIVHMFSHQNIRRCAQAIHRVRWKKHWLLACAVSLMMVIKFFFLDWFQTDAIYPIYHPQRWLGYLAAAIMLVVSADILYSRMRSRVEMHRFSHPSDIILPVMLLLIALIGLSVHVFRYLGFALTSHILYAVHLAVAVPAVLVELPFGKWSHAFYRPFALYFQAVKERVLEELSAKQPLPEQIPAGVETA